MKGENMISEELTVSSDKFIQWELTVFKDGGPQETKATIIVNYITSFWKVDDSTFVSLYGGELFTLPMSYADFKKEYTRLTVGEHAPLKVPDDEVVNHNWDGKRKKVLL